MLEGLGEKDPASVLKIGKRLRPNRDVAIFVLWRQGIYTNREIGETFGIGYTAVTGAARRGEEYLLADERLKRKVEKIVILNDM